jgi:hypothetical protein
MRYLCFAVNQWRRLGASALSRLEPDIDPDAHAADEVWPFGAQLVLRRRVRGGAQSETVEPSGGEH